MVLAVPAPPVRAAGSRLTAPVYGADVTDDITFLANTPLFIGTQTVAQSIPNNTITSLTLDSETVDTYNGHSTSVNTSRYTPTVPGYYEVNGVYGPAASASGNRFLLVAKNGVATALGQGGGAAAAATNTGSVQVTDTVFCNGSTDYIEIRAFQNSGGALNTAPSPTGMTVRWVHA
ncbi:hypothetical protein [Kitasatospora sp. MBT63]|uniref:hypothetical protein n=1 Tax=Kitasatospora sp. MBT63 TaxID=1444768 RepID=UPI00068B3A9A|nr:hypothetical protein [Kitasatospora sp. MBT63]